VMGVMLKETIEDLEKYHPAITIENLISNQVIRSFSGGTPPTNDQKYWNGPIPWVTPKDMKRWYIDESQDHIFAIAVEEKKTKLIPRKSVLLVVRGMILARDLPIGINLREVTINQDMKAFHCTDDLVPEYLGYMLRARAPLILDKVEIAGHGTRRLKTDTLEQVAIPNAPKDIQMQVIAHLDATQSSINTMQNTLKENDGLLKQVKQAILHEAFRGEL
jgi:restriction endonuclease S subunit